MIHSDAELATWWSSLSALQKDELFDGIDALLRAVDAVLVPRTAPACAERVERLTTDESDDDGYLSFIRSIRQQWIAKKSLSPKQINALIRWKRVIE